MSGSRSISRAAGFVSTSRPEAFSSTTPSTMPVRIASMCVRSRAMSDSRTPSSRAVLSSAPATMPISSAP